MEDALGRLLARPGLEPVLRLLTRAKTLIWPGAWEDLGATFRAAREAGAERSLFEEMLLQAVLFCGFPRCVSAFDVLAREWPADSPPSGGSLPAEQRHEAGESMFSEIYGKNATAVRSMLRSCHGEFHDFVLDVAYGRILSRPGLDPKARELLAAGMLAVMNQVPQLIAHARGALRFGANDDEVSEAIYTGVLDTEMTAELMRKIQQR